MLPDLIRAIHSRLTSDAGLNSVVPASRIANFVQDDAEFPHIDWRIESVESGDIKGEESYEGEIVLEAFSDYSGDLQSFEIHQLVYSALQRQPLSVDGADNVFLSFRSINVATDDDNRTRQATIVYAFMIGET